MGCGARAKSGYYKGPKELRGKLLNEEHFTFGYKTNNKPIVVKMFLIVEENNRSNSSSTS